MTLRALKDTSSHRILLWASASARLLLFEDILLRTEKDFQGSCGLGQWVESCLVPITEHKEASKARKRGDEV